MPLLLREILLMLHKARFLAGLLAVLASVAAHADLTIKMLPFKGSESQLLKDRLDALTRKHVDEHSLVSKDYPYTPATNFKDYLRLFASFDAQNTRYKDPATLYTLELSGRDYLAAVVSYNPMLTAEPNCQPNDSALPTGHCERIALRQRTCHLFLFEPETLRLESVTPLNIVRDPRPMLGQKERSFSYYDDKRPNDPRQIEGWPNCSKLLAVAPATAVPNSLLFALGYYDSAATVHKFDEPPLFKTSVLLSFQTDTAGKLQVVQNEYCLGNPNSYSSIAAARKALAACAVQKKVSQSNRVHN